jgi:Type IV pilin-like G and H, putative
MSDKFNTELIKKTTNRYVPFLLALSLIPISSVVYANPSIGHKNSQVVMNISTANKLQTVSTLENNKFATTFDQLAMANFTGGRTTTSKKFAYKIDIRSQNLAIIGAKPLNRKLYGYNGAVLRFKTDRGLVGTVSIVCQSQTLGGDGTDPNRAPIVETELKLRCADGWKDVFAAATEQERQK